MGTLEDISLWHKYKTSHWPPAIREDLLDEATLTKPQETAHNAMRILRGVRVQDLIYINCPITSGRRMYELLDDDPTLADDPAKLRKRVISDNVQEGKKYFRHLIDQGHNVIWPGAFVPAWQRWEQGEFQALWLTLIAEMAYELRPVDGWQYSTGAAEEFTHIHQLKLGTPHSSTHTFHPTLQETLAQQQDRWNALQAADTAGSVISLAQGIDMIGSAVEEIESRYEPPSKLVECLAVLERTEELLQQGFYQPPPE